jgi:hypothetical protein
MDSQSQSKIEALEWAFEMQSGTEYGLEVHCYISKLTGDIVNDDEEMSGVPCSVEDIEGDADYLRLPDKFDLDLGQCLVWRFVEIKIPGLEQKVREIFSRRGAYRRWKDFLDRNYLLDKCHTIESLTAPLFTLLAAVLLAL